MPLRRLIDYLDEQGKKYVIIKHSPAFTAQEVAASAHIPGKEMVKTVIIKVDGEMKMVVLPSTHNVDFNAIKETLGVKGVALATEKEFEDLFPDCELGAIPPFGHFYDIDTLAGEVLAEDDEIAFNAGTHKELVQMEYEDYKELAEPRIISAGIRK
ncbi:MAG TPA: YbaK/EbsC family protein [Fodinibius sp.]|nr:YbaK/EbsC family protein [Fodinibius sp.]